MTVHSWPRRRREPDLGPLLMDAIDSIADMADRVRLNGPEVNYAAEKLTWARYRTAEALALCGVELQDVLTEVHGGFAHGAWLKEEV
ncbi:MAG: hypothetical protein ACLP0L_17655 [Solirubrobacteraceae bacterium]